MAQKVTGKAKKVLRFLGFKDDSAAFSQLIQDLSVALHNEKKTLTVILEDRTLTAARPMAWSGIVASADQVGFMGYQYHDKGTGEGAMALPDDVFRLAENAERMLNIPSGEVRIDLGMYGFDWPVGRKRKKKDIFVVGTLDRFNELAKAHHSTLGRDAETQSARLWYWIDHPVFRKKKLIRTEEEGRSVWFEDGISIRYKIDKLRVGVIGIWQLGTKESLSPLFEKSKPKSSTSPSSSRGGLILVFAVPLIVQGEHASRNPAVL